MATTFQEQITSYSGFSSFTTTSTPSLNVATDILNRAIIDILKILPEGLFLRYLTKITDGDGSGMSLETGSGSTNDHVYALYINDYKARLVDTTEYRMASKANSIYVPSDCDPIYAVGATGASTIDPLPSSVSTDYYQVAMPVLTALTGSFSSSTTAVNDATDYGPVPPEAEDAIILTAVIKLLQIKLDQAVEDEDGELVNVTQAEITRLQELYQFELSKLLGPAKET